MSDKKNILPDHIVDMVEAGDAEGVASALCKTPDLVSALWDDGDTLLHVAAGQKQAKIVDLLLAAGAEIEARGFYSRTPLHCAVNDGSIRTIPIVKALMKAGADPSLRDKGGNTVADWAKSEMDDGLEETLAVLAGKS